MPLDWLDVGSWTAFAKTRPQDEANNAIGAERHLLQDTSNCLVVSNDPEHLIATIGCEEYDTDSHGECDTCLPIRPGSADQSNATSIASAIRWMLHLANFSLHYAGPSVAIYHN